MAKKQKLPYGSWPSPVSVDDMTQHSVGLGEIQVFNGLVYWIEMRPEEKGRYVIVEFNGKTYRDINPPTYNARTRVHEYGGGSYLVCAAGIYFVNFVDQQIYHVKDDRITQLTETSESRYADLILDEVNKQLIAVCETHEPGKEAKNSLVTVDLDSGRYSHLWMAQIFIPIHD